MFTKDEIQFLKDLVEPINNNLSNLNREVSHIKTVLKTFATKEDLEIAVKKSEVNIMAKMATKQDLEEAKIEIKVDIQNLDAKFANKLQNHEKSIKVLHEATNTADPNKH
jgi:squalene cyclase